MKGIILAGGAGTRLYPVTKVVNKHLLLVYNKPMIYYPLNTLVNAGLKDIIIVSGKENLDSFKKLLTGNGKFSNVNFNFVVQKQAAGIADALRTCKKLTKGEKIVAVLGDNIIEDDITEIISNFEKQNQGARIFLKEVKQPEKFDIAIIKDNKIIDFEEKPVSPKSNLAVTGLYLYDNQIWQIIDDLQPSFRGELEITDVNNYYLKRNQLGYNILKKDWFDLDTFSTLLQANLKMAQK
ncbi:MAG: NTP transferase domain-containing protein [Candidatus Buchananbacteria bacterium]|nr:NTP transferase domain-containing protein [Candidatus Buchananbacteria bacterium]